MGVTSAAKALLLIAVLLFVGFLVSPGFVDSVKGDGTVTMLPGFAAVLWHALLMSNTLTQAPGEALALLLLLLAHVSFVILPLAVALGCFRPRALRYIMCALFVCGGLVMVWMVWGAEHVSFGVYLWLLGALFACTYCLLPSAP